MDYEGRISKVARQLDELEVDALLVTDLTNVRYLTGFSGTNGQLLVTPSDAIFLTDPRYEGRARELVRAAAVLIYPERLTDELRQRLPDAAVRRLGFEAKTVTVAQRDDLDERLVDVEPVATTGVVESLRRTKDPEEVELIREAVRLGDSAFGWALSRIAPGVTERELALELEVRMRESGADDVSFEPIVGSGPLSAHVHHTPTDRTMEKGELVLLDFGCRWQGYCSDLTRTVVLGAGAPEQHALYDTVLAAQGAGLQAVSTGATGIDVDAAARRVIEEAGHGERFGHGLGHGVGLQIHEAPRLHRISEDTLTSGDVVTVEPGVYVPGVGGVRIEDCVLVLEGKGAEVLTGAPKDRLLEV
jgi:Xaa-Pro aminopeptidase